ncbi:MAG: hypothetical protein EOP05_04295 [Proteobacteria bacterium]|nr:MAG: hypothetical protein EOP05_04295 [Pseudomonadota bacterium]
MAKIIASVFLLTALALPNLAEAKSDPELREVILKSFRQHCEELAQQGVSSFAGVSVATIIAKSESVMIDFNDSVKVKDADVKGAVRTTAYWNPKTQTLSVSEAHARTSDASGMSGILVHEMFRAVGIDDENYDASSVLNAYLRVRDLNSSGKIYLQNPNSLNILRSHILEKGTFQKRNGISGVGGGGDIGTQLIKEALVAELLFDLDESKLTEKQFRLAVKLLAGLRFENSPNLLNGDLKRSSDWKTIVVPMNPLSASSSAISWQTVILPVKASLIRIARTRIPE